MNGNNCRLLACLVFVTCCSACTSIRTTWGDFLGTFTGDNDSASEKYLSLTDSEIVDGLKEALVKSTKSAISNLGRTDGFFRNPRVKIPMPDSLGKVEKALRKLKQDKIADEFILSMNRAAERAVPEAAQIFSVAIQQMSFDDAREILQGPDNAATEYFRRTSSSGIAEKMLPIVRNATNAVGVTVKYKEMTDKLGFASSLIDKQPPDLDRYVTGKAVNGLFRMLADEEKLIRRDPAARTSELLKKVFAK